MADFSDLRMWLQIFIPTPPKKYTHINAVVCMHMHAPTLSLTHTHKILTHTHTILSLSLTHIIHMYQ
jgi:hypothetical protein